MCVPTVVYLLKEPEPGRVKTRLAVDLGDDEACRVYRALAERQFRALPPGWPVEIHFAPADAGPRIRHWLTGAGRYVPQVDGDLGARLAAASEGAFARGAPQVFFIGADCPYLVFEDFVRALHKLATGRDAVFGPARDGGYYLLATRRHRPELFREIPWSTERVLRRSLEKAERLGLATALLDEKEDIDDLSSFRRYFFSRDAGSLTQ